MEKNKTNDFSFNVLDGSLEFQFESMERFLADLTEEEKARSMSDEFAYLDEGLDEELAHLYDENKEN